jgi:hypothetical protein
VGGPQKPIGSPDIVATGHYLAVSRRGKMHAAPR